MAKPVVRFGGSSMRRAHTPRSPPEPRARVLQVAGKAGEPPTRNVPRAPDSANASTPAQPACMSVQAGFTTPVQTRIRTQACARCADRSPATALATSRMHCRRRRSTILAITINRVLFPSQSLAPSKVNHPMDTSVSPFVKNKNDDKEWNGQAERCGRERILKRHAR